MTVKLRSLLLVTIIAASVIHTCSWSIVMAKSTGVTSQKTSAEKKEKKRTPNKKQETPPSYGKKHRLSTHNDWSSYKMRQFGSMALFCISKPIKQEGKYKKRGIAYAMITHRPKMGSYDVISFEAGYKFKEGSDVKVIIDNKSRFSLATFGETAWCRSIKEEKKLLKAMLRGNKLVIKGVSSRGTRTTDTYSLRGLSKSYRTICKKCNHKGV